MGAITPQALDRLGAHERVLLGGEVLVTYARVRWVMRDDDASRAVRRLRRRDRSERRLEEAEAERAVTSAWRLALATRRVLRLLPADSRCLFSSLTLMCLLERRGLPHTVVLAVRSSPFGAHAWVEVCGEAVLPAAEPGYERLLEI